MSYWGLFWETGMPEAWALSRKSGEKPDASMAAQSWPQAALDQGLYAVVYDPANVVPGDNAGRPVPTPDDGKTKT